MNTPALPHRASAPSDHDTIEDPATARALSTVRRGTSTGGDGGQWEDASTQRNTEPQDALVPGRFWRCLEAYSVPDERYSGHVLRCHEQEIYLIERVIEFDGSIHSVVLCDSPLRGGSNHIPVVLLDLLRLFAPVDPVEARQIRAAQMDSIMAEVKDAQAEMAEASIKPMSLPSVVEAVESAVAAAEHEHASEARSAQTAKEKRDADLRRIHRRAGRRAQAKGNPLQTTAPAISTSISQMVSHGLNDEMVRTLTLEAGKHLAAGEALGKWLSRKSEDIARTLTRMTPFYQEQQRVAMASAADAVKRVADLQKGIRSLRLYTGDALDVMTLRTGKSAPTSEPLTLFQAKRYMDQELACFMEVDDSFDWRSRETFFAELVANPALLEQIMPAPRCVVSMAVTGRHVQYSRNMHWYDRLKNELANKAVFLLVRDGENLHVVYSDEPSHEAADRLFPTEGDLQGLFDGIDGSRITLADVRFGRASEEFADLALHYKRFLILLCGLDHRMRLMGEFYPPEQASAFMTLEFQQSHMRFVHDDEAALMLEDGAAARPTMPVEDWIMACNARVRTGARVVVPRESLRAALLAGAPRVAKSKLDKSALRGRAGDYFVVRSVGAFTRSMFRW